MPEAGADLDRITNEIVSMPNYFADYNTTVHFIDEEELEKNHSGKPHGGFVIRTGVTGEDTKQRLEFRLDLDSNPEFTASVLVAYTRAVYRLYREGRTELLLHWISHLVTYPQIREELRRELL